MGKLATILIATVAIGGGTTAGLYGYRINQARVSAQSNLATRDKELVDCRNEVTTEKSAKTLVEKNLKDTSTTLANSNSELDALKKQQADADKRLAAFKDLTEKFRKMIDAGKLTVVHRNGRMVVKLPAGVLFASGSADISNEGRSALAEVASILKQVPDRRFMVAGHTDNVPLAKSTYKNNWELSTARAVTVVTQLVAAGMAPQKLSAAGYSEYEPVRSNASEAGRHENRRIEIVLLPNLAELPPVAEAKN